MSQFSQDNYTSYVSDYSGAMKDELLSNQEGDLASGGSTSNQGGSSSPLVFVFGQNSYGELGLGKFYRSHHMSIGDTQERNAPAQVRFFDDLNISQIAAGNEHIAVLTKAGEVFTVGFNGSGQLGHGNNRS